VGLHGIVGTSPTLPAYASTSGWFNVCSMLDTDQNLQFYHRGYPQKKRWIESNHFISTSKTSRTVAVNAGLWLDNPDIDALTRMERQPVARALKQPWTSNFCLSAGTWCPFNSQNTAIMRAAIPAYFLSPYNGRYDDIWASYILTRIAEHLNHAIAFGEPLVRQERNPHDLWRDLDVERNGMIMTDDFCDALRSIKLTGGAYSECFSQLAGKLRSTWKEDPKWTESQREWRSRLLEGMEIWSNVFSSLGVRRLETVA
jgi:hypothetical protein